MEFMSEQRCFRRDALKIIEEVVLSSEQ